MKAKESDILREKLATCGYLCGDDLALVLLLAEKLKKPLLLEGPAGVGKTELARAYAAAVGRELIRLQCYEGLDERRALYEWDYQKQLLYLESQRETDWAEAKKDLFSEEFLLARPLLKAFLSPRPTVLLIDEIDKADEEFESFLLEALADYAVTIPEKGTVQALTVPMVFLTGNASRELSDGLKRRCVHYYIEYPTPEREEAIIKAHLPMISTTLAAAVAAFVAKVRKLSLNHVPGIAETLDWAAVVCELALEDLDGDIVDDTYHFLVKSKEDLKKVKEL